MNTNNAAPLASFSHTNNVTAVGFQADRRWVFTGSEDGTIKVWDPRSPQRAQRNYTCGDKVPFRQTCVTPYMRPTPAAVNSVVLHPNQGELISGDQNGRVCVWDLAADRCSAELSPRLDAQKALGALDATPDSISPHAQQYISSGQQQDRRHMYSYVHQAPSQIEKYATASVAKHIKHLPIRSVAIASDASRLVCGDNNADVYFWRLTQARQFEFEHLIRAAHDDGSGHTYILKTAISPDAQLLVTTSSDKTAKLWNIDRDFALERTLAQHQRWVWDACFSADSAYLVTASSDHSARLWDLHSGSAIRYYVGHVLSVTCCALNDSST